MAATRPAAAVEPPARVVAGGSPQSAIAWLYWGLTRAMTRATEVFSRSRNGFGYRPIHTASTMSGAKVANSRPFRSISVSFFGFSTLPNIVR